MMDITLSIIVYEIPTAVLALMFTCGGGGTTSKRGCAFGKGEAQDQL